MKYLIPIAVMLSILTSSSYGKIRLATYNINYSRSAENEWKWPERRDRVADLIRKIDADVLALQEVVKSSPASTHDSELSFDDIEQTLNSQGYEFFKAPFKTDREGVEQYLVSGIKKDKLNYESVRHLTYHLNEIIPVERSRIELGSVLVTALKLNEETIIIYNHHFPMSAEGRMVTAHGLGTLQKTVLKDLQIENDANFITIHMGDFNSFPDDKGPEQVASILKQGFTDAGIHARWSHLEVPVNDKISEKVSYTFVGFPHDVDRAAAKGIDFRSNEGHLDHIFLSNNASIVDGSVLVWNADPLELTYNYKYWQGGGEFKSSIFPSDHLPMSVDLEL